MIAPKEMSKLGRAEDAQRIAEFFGGEVVREHDLPGRFCPGVPGGAFKNGRLYRFDSESVCVLEHPRDLRSWSKTKEKPFWHSSRNAANFVFSDAETPSTPVVYDEYTDEPRPSPQVAAVKMEDRNFELPDGQLVWPFFYRHVANMRQHCYAKLYLAQFPQGRIVQVQKFSSRRWQLLCALMRCDGADDLCFSNPALFYALANNWVFHKPAVHKPLNAVRRLVRKPQIKILEWLGFPASKSISKILSRIDPKSINIERLLYLRNALENPVVLKWLQHIPRINWTVMRFACDEKLHPYLTPRFLGELGAQDEWAKHSAPTFFKLFDMIRIAGELRAPLSPLQSLVHFERFHDELSREYNRRNKAVYYHNAVLPEAPYPGDHTILPIRSYGELLKEGEEQKHCIASFVDLIINRKVCAYRVLAPVRCTLTLKRTQARRWELDQLFGKRNTAVPISIRATIIKNLNRSLQKRGEAH